MHPSHLLALPHFTFPQTDRSYAPAPCPDATSPQLLSSAHRTLDASNADFFYVPTYLACTILPVYDWVGPGPYSHGYPMRPVTAMRMSYDALEQVRTRWPYFNQSVERIRNAKAAGATGAALLPNHIFLFAHDEGACWAPQELFEHSIILTHWGRMDARPQSSSRYIPDNWEHAWFAVERAPNGQRWGFERGGRLGSRGMIGTHPCYDPLKDIVIPVYSPPSNWWRSPLVLESSPHQEQPQQQQQQGGVATGAAAAAEAGATRSAYSGTGAADNEDEEAQMWAAARSMLNAPRPTLAYFSGNLAVNEPLKYARGVRHRLRAAFRGKPGWKLVGKAGSAYSVDLGSSEFCLVPPGGDGWSSRVDDSVRHGCIPVIIMDNVHLPFETSLNYSSFAIRVREADVEQIDAILRSVPSEVRRAMRLAMRRIWTRFVYARSFVDADAYLGGGSSVTASSERRVLPRSFLQDPPVRSVAHAMNRGAPDALDTIMLELALRLETSQERQAHQAR